MEIAKLTRRGSKVLINFSDYERVYVSYEVAVKHGLRSGDNLSDESFAKLLEEDSLFKIRSSAYRSLARRLHTKKELHEKLLRKEYPEELIFPILDDLEEKGYIDDLRFTERFIEEKSQRKGLSQNRIKMELTRKGIPRTIAEDFLKRYYSEDVYLKNAIKHVQKRKKVLARKDLSPQQMKQKIFQSLHYKGFDSGVINKAINETEKEL